MTKKGKYVKTEFVIDIADIIEDGKVDQVEWTALGREWQDLVRAARRDLISTTADAASDILLPKPPIREKPVAVRPIAVKKQGLDPRVKQKLVFLSIVGPAALASAVRLLGFL